MPRPGPSTALSQPTSLHVQVLGPDASERGVAEVRRLLSVRSSGRFRRDRLEHATRVVARWGAQVVGVAAYERVGAELRVLEMVVDSAPPVCHSEVVVQLFSALEMAALAGGCLRVVLLPAAVLAASALEPLGYRVVNEGVPGGWLEKALLG
jgi:acetolactate synthase regulatory subunit